MRWLFPKTSQEKAQKKSTKYFWLSWNDYIVTREPYLTPRCWRLILARLLLISAANT